MCGGGVVLAIYNNSMEDILIKLIKAHVLKYKSIDDSSPVDINEAVTVLVGKNESGKTAFLEALHKALPLGKATFNPVFDYPRKDYIRYRPQHDSKNYAKVVELTFAIGPELAGRINKELFNNVEVIKPEQTLRRTTNYGNEHSISLGLDIQKALSSLKRSLEGIELSDQVFNTAKDLEEVLSRIAGMGLPADSRLSIFAKEWKDRVAGASSGWDAISFHVWNAYLSPSLPRFLYFDDYSLLQGKLNLETLNHRKTQGTTTESDQTALGLLELAGITIKDLMSEEGYENSKAKLEAIGLNITQQVFEYWKQNKDLAVEFDIKADPKDDSPFNTGKNLYIRIKNLRHGVTVPFDQRSKGFIWFFSFMVWFSAVESRAGTEKDVVLLLDEPGLNLHALAQADFLGFIEKLSVDRQIIYTTHSPFMVESERLERVRVVEDRSREGTKVTGNLQGSSDESLFPLQAALGYSVAQNLFISKKNILVEGPADLLILQHVSSLLEASGKCALDEGVYVPVGGLDKLATFVALLGANKLKLVVLHDRGTSPHQGLESLIHQKLIERKRVLDYGMYRIPENLETDIEDLVPASVYIDAFNSTYSSELGGMTVDVAELGQHPRIVERINEWLKAKGVNVLKAGGFNHYRVAQALLPRLTVKSFSSRQLASFEQLFDRLNALLKQ
jgi:energy-coupling factor transporter ATP-binding protein EcfA2